MLVTTKITQLYHTCPGEALAAAVLLCHGCNQLLLGFAEQVHLCWL